MSKYELMYIAKPELDETKQKDVLEKIKKLIETKSGQIVEVISWGKRDLAYPIEGLTQGIYTLIHYEAVGDTNFALAELFKITEEVIRHMIIKVNSFEKTQKSTEPVSTATAA